MVSQSADVGDKEDGQGSKDREAASWSRLAIKAD
jgi:hypothetical protein